MIVVDIETTGLDPKNNSIIEIGAIDFDNPENQFYQKCRIYDGAKFDPMALEINGNSEANINDASRQSLKELLLNFIDWVTKIDDRTIAGHNVNFDLRFLCESIRRYEIEWNFGRRIVDQHSLIYAHYLKLGLEVPLKLGSSNLNGDEIMKFVGIPPEPRPHNGLNGAIYEAEAISRIVNRKKLFKEFENFEIPEYLK